MILKTVRVQNFKSIEDSTEFSVEDITALVGKNESGKSAILEALYKLNPIVDAHGKFDEVEEYPRRKLGDYEEEVEADASKKAKVLTTVWALTEEEKQLLRRKFGDAVPAESVTIEKGYSNTWTWIFDHDESRAIQRLLAESNLKAPDRNALKSQQSISDLTAALKAIQSPNAEQAALLKRVGQLYPNGSLFQAVARTLIPYLPKFVLFSDYDRLPGQMQLEGLQQRQSQGATSLTDDDRMFLAFLQQAGTDIGDIIGAGKFEHFVSRLESVSNRISDRVFEYWSQNRHLLVEFRVDQGRAQDPPPFNSGTIFRIRIKNTRHGVTVSFDERSTGFVWFFSFLVWLSQAKKNYGERLFILLDEPGLSLHARAQADLLRYFEEKLRPLYQVVYTTHSPFMIDPKHILAARTVEDVIENEKPLGTKVGDRILSTDRDTIFPLQAALGYDVTQTLFVAPDTLLVEGPSDLLYMQALSHMLRKKGRKGLDPRWTIAPTGGVDKIASFVALFGANRLHLAIFTDFHEGMKRKIKDLRESSLLKTGHVFSADMYVSQSEADIEDLLGRDLYIALVTRCYELTGANLLPTTRPEGASVRVVKEVGDHFKVLSPGSPEFDHFAPARFLLECSDDLFSKLPGSDAALERFEKLFADLNALLPKQT